MKVTFTLSDLSRVVPQVAKLPTSKFMTQLSMLRFVCEKDKAFITGSDGNIWLTRQVPCEADKACEFLVDPSDVSRLLTIDDESLAFDIDPKKGALVCKYSSGKMQCSILPSEDYPEPPKMMKSKDVTVNTAVLRKLIQDVRCAVDAGEKVRTTQGILIEGTESSITAVATNTHHMHVSSADWSGAIRIVLISKMADLIGASDDSGDVTIEWSEDQNIVSASSEFTVIAGPLVGGTFPTWQRAVPSDFIHCIEIKGSDAIKKLKRVLSCAPDSNRTVWRVASGVLSIYAVSAKNSDINEELPCSAGVEFQWAANGQFMLDAIQCAESESVKIETSPARPLRIRSVQESGFQAVVMPMALDSVEDGK